MKTFFKTLSAAALALILAACGGQKDSAPAASASAAADNGAEKKEIVFGTTVGDFGDMVKEHIQPELEKKGYTVKLVEFTDYVRPNLRASWTSTSSNTNPILTTSKKNTIWTSPKSSKCRPRLWDCTRAS